MSLKRYGNPLPLGGGAVNKQKWFAMFVAVAWMALFLGMVIWGVRIADRSRDASVAEELRCRNDLQAKNRSFLEQVIPRLEAKDPATVIGAMDEIRERCNSASVNHAKADRDFLRLDLKNPIDRKVLQVIDGLRHSQDIAVRVSADRAYDVCVKMAW